LFFLWWDKPHIGLRAKYGRKLHHYDCGVEYSPMAVALPLSAVRSDFRYAGSSELRITTFRSQSSPGSHIALQKAERSKIIMAYMAFSGHDSEQPVNPSDVHLVINSVPAFIHTAMPDGYLDFFNELR
jgi:hypothetical protein